MTLQGRISFIVVVTFVSFWTAASYFSINKLERDIANSMDNRLQATAAMMQNILHSPAANPSIVGKLGSFNANDAGTAKGLACKISSLSGEVIATSHPDTFARAANVTPGFDVVEENNIKWRTYTSQTPSHTITIADKLSERDALYYQTVVTTALPSAIALLISILFIHIAVKKSLAPLHKLSNTLQHRGINDLRPVKLNTAFAELTPLVDSQNALLARLQHAIEREKSFTDNAAHELRTPLTGILSQLQVARVTEGAVHDKAIKHCEASAHKLQKLIEGLLLLSRVEAGKDLQVLNKWSPVAEVNSIIAEFGADAEKIDVEIDAQDPISQLPLFAIQVISRNLIDNALRYGDKNTRVAFSLHAMSWGVDITCRNKGAVSEENLSQLTHRFWRGSVQPGSGLGLAVVEAITTRFNGNIIIENGADDTFCVSVQLRSTNSR